MAGTRKTYQFEEVTKHHVTNDCWLIISGKVYDVTPFMAEHPGGDEVLLAATGKDATRDFEDIGHSQSARDLMDKYYIGKVDISTVPKKRHFFIPTPKSFDPENTSEFIIKASQVLAPLLILGLTYAVKQYTKVETAN